MISNNLILAAASQSGYGQYQAPPNYIWGVGSSFYGEFDSNITALEPTQMSNTNNWNIIGVGSGTSYAIKTDGTLWAWGNNGSGELGASISIVTNVSSPVQVGSLTDWQNLSMYQSQNSHMFAIKTDGTLWGWGANTYGQLGNGTSGNIYSSPIQIGLLTNWSQVSCGANHTMAIKTDGTLWAWGRNNLVQLGDGTNISKSSPIQIGSLTDWSQVSCGNGHTMAIKTDGTLWAWGANTNYRLGTGDLSNYSSPVQIGLLTDWVKVVCGFNHTFAMKSNGTLWAWGYNGEGQLGLNSSNFTVSSPTQIGLLNNWTDIESGNGGGYARKSNGTLWAWGVNTYGQLGNGTTTSYSSPIQIGSLTDWNNFAAGNAHIIAKKTDGTIWSWGGNVRIESVGTGYLGAIGRDVLYSSPIQITNISNISNISLNSTSVHAIKKDGTLWTWGHGIFGEMGHNSVFSNASPVQIGTATNWSKISSGVYYTMAIKTDGTLWGWGGNTNGELGNGTSGNMYSSPIQIGLLTNWSQVSCGNGFTIAVKTDGTLWAWGVNTYGQLGDASTTPYSSPIQIGSLTDWSKVFAGSNHTMAIKTDGTLWAWGRNNRGQLGIGNLINRSSPVQVGLLTNWNDIAVGGNTDSYTLSVKTDGTLWAWGRNFNGQLGNGTTTSYSSPIQIGSLTDWKNVYATKTSDSVIAIKTNGTLWSWGLNNRGQLGLGNRTNRSSPVQIGTLTSWVSGSCGDFSSLFLTS